MGTNAFHRLRTPSTAHGAVPLPRGGRAGASPVKAYGLAVDCVYGLCGHPYDPSRALSKSLIQLRVQGLNPGRFNGGYGVPRGFKGEKSKFPPNPLGLRSTPPHSPQAMQSFPIRLRARQNLRFCRRLHIGALRSPLSPFARPLEDSYTTPGAGHTKKISAQHPSPPLRRINQPFQRVDAAYALVIGGRVVVKRQNQFGV